MSRLSRKLKAKSKKLAKQAWRSYRASVKRRRQARRELRRQTRAARAVEQRDEAVRAESFWARHPLLMDWRDAAAQKGHELLDRRELRSGIITQEELDAFDDFNGPEEWRLAMQRRRKQRYAEQRASRRDGEYGPLVLVYGGGQRAGVPQVKHVGFKAPAPRVAAASPRPVSTFQAPKHRRVRRKNRVETVVAQWRPLMERNARVAMAADGNLTGALDSIREFAQQFPESRTQVHDHLGKLAELGKGFSACMETMLETLAKGKGEDNPGMPSDVLNHGKPLTEAGAAIENACLAMIAAWEDYFQEAIKAAQDEHTPSKQALTS